MPTLVFSSKQYDRSHILSYSAAQITDSVHQLMNRIFKHSYGETRISSGRYEFFYPSTNGCKKYIVRVRKIA